MYALSASFGYLFGLTDEGRALLVNDQTGATEEVRSAKRECSSTEPPTATSFVAPHALLEGRPPPG